MPQYDGSVKFDTKIDTAGMTGALSKLKTTAAATFAAIGTAGTLAIKECLSAGMSFTATMSKVEAISGATSQDLQKLTDKAKEMGATTVFSASQSAEALTYMAMAGWKTEDMLSGIEGIMNLAASAGEDLGAVSDIVTDALTGFGLKASDSAHFADVLAIASSNANTNVSMLGGTFKYAAPLAGALGYSVEDVAVAAGLMANAGIKAEQAGTSLRSMFSRLANPPKAAAAALATLEVSIENTDGSAKPLMETIVELRTKFASLTETEKTTFAAQIAGQEAMSGLLAIVNASEADFVKLTSAVNNADGAAKKMADTMVDNLKGDLVLMESALEGVKIAVYDNLEKPFRTIVKTAAETFSELEKSMSGGELQPKVEKLGGSLADFAEGIADFASDALPVVIDGLTFLIDNLDLLMAAFAGAMNVKLLHGAMNAYNVVMGMSTARVAEYTAALAFEQSTEARGITVSSLVLSQMTLKDLLVGVLTGKITLATAAQNLWNAAMNSNPIGLLITALGVLIPLIGVGMSRALGDSRKEADKFNESLKEINDTYDNSIKAAEDHKNTAIAEAEKIEYLKNRIYELDDALEDNSEDTDENRKKKKELVSAVNDLKKLIPELNIQIDEETGRLRTERGEVDKLTEAYRQLAYAKAYQAYYQESFNAAFKKKADLEQELKKEQEKLDSMPVGTVSEGFVRSDKKDKTKGTKIYIKSDERYAYEKQEAKIALLTDDIRQAGAEVDELLGKMYEWASEVENLTPDEPVTPGGSGGGVTYTPSDTGDSSESETAVEQELRNLRYSFEMGEKSAEEFYNALEEYRDNYCKEGSKEYQELTLEIKRGREKLAQETAEINEEELREQENARREAIEKELSDNERKLRRREISEEEYYAELERIRDEYYDETDEEYAELTDKIIEHNNRMADETAEAVKTAVNNTAAEISSFADSALGKVETKIDSIKEKVRSYGDFLEDGENGKVLSDLSKANEELFEYGQYLSIIKDRVQKLGFGKETADGLFTALSEMSVEDALSVSKLLYDTSDSDFRKYVTEFGKRETLAKQISDSFFKDDYEKAVDETAGYMKLAFEKLGVEIPPEFFNSGKDSAEEFGTGFLSELSLQMETIRQRIAAFNMSLGSGFSVPVASIFGDADAAGGVTNNTYNNTYNIVNPAGTVTDALERSAREAEIDRMRNG